MIRREHSVQAEISAEQHVLLQRLKAPHQHSIDVHFEDTDATGVVFHPAYLRFFDRARTALLGASTLVRIKERLEVGFVVHKCSVTFRAPARFGDRLTVRTTLGQPSHHKLDFEQAIHDRAAGTLIARAETRVVCVGLDGKAVPVPVRSILELVELYAVLPQHHEGL
jgi:tol-pal system-associated acyl-CoA thioesterase